MSETHRVNRPELLTSLLRAAPGLSKKGTIEQSSCVVFGEGCIRTFNDEISCRVRCALPDDFVGAVRADRLTDVLQAMTDDLIDMKINNGKLMIRTASGTDRVELKMEAEVVLPLDMIKPPDTWITLPPGFKDAVEKVISAAGSNAEEFLFTCVHIHPDFLEATDRKQFVRWSIETGVTEPFLVRADSLERALKLEVLHKMGVTPNWVHFRNKGMFLSCRRHLEKFPSDKIQEIIQFRGTPVTLPQGIDAGSNLCSVLTRENGELNKVNVFISSGQIVMRGEGVGGTAEKHLQSTYGGDPISFRISPVMLTEIVSKHNDCEIGDGKLRVSGDHWSYLVALGAIDTTVKSE